MRSLTCALAVVLVAGCAKEKPATQSAPPPPPPAPAAINLADVAGNWTVKAMPATGDSVLLTYTLHATAADTGWTITFSGRKPMAVQVATMGDSVMVTAPAYESMLRKGTKVSTQGVMHLVNGTLTGTTTAHYVTTKADSVIHLRMEGTKMP
ncbi:MAG: hypothetical protein ACYCVL_09390 [Gemmatimonadaceae bacterium]